MAPRESLGVCYEAGFEPPAQEATLLDSLHEVEHVADRIDWPERAINEAVQTAPPSMQVVIEAPPRIQMAPGKPSPLAALSSVPE